MGRSRGRQRQRGVHAGRQRGNGFERHVRCAETAKQVRGDVVPCKWPNAQRKTPSPGPLQAVTSNRVRADSQPLDQVARLDRPDMFEEDIMRYTMQMEDMLLHGPHGIASGSGSGGRGAPAAPPWRLANPRKTVTIGTSPPQVKVEVEVKDYTNEW